MLHYIANAISDELPANLGFGITGVNTATLVYSVVFTVIALLTSPIAKYFGPHNWLISLMSAWAIVTWSHAFITVRKTNLNISNYT